MVRGGPGTKKSTSDYKKIRILIYLFNNQTNPTVKYTIMMLPSKSGWNVGGKTCGQLLGDLISDGLVSVHKVKQGRKKILEIYKITDKGKDFVQAIRQFERLDIKSFEIFKAFEEPTEYMF